MLSSPCSLCFLKTQSTRSIIFRAVAAEPSTFVTFPHLSVWAIFNFFAESKAVAAPGYEKQRGKALTSWICSAPTPCLAYGATRQCSLPQKGPLPSYLNRPSVSSSVDSVDLFPSLRGHCCICAPFSSTIVLAAVLAARRPTVPPTGPQDNLQHRHHYFVRCLFGCFSVSPDDCRDHSCRNSTHSANSRARVQLQRQPLRHQRLPLHTSTYTKGNSLGLNRMWLGMWFEVGLSIVRICSIVGLSSFCEEFVQDSWWVCTE